MYVANDFKRLMTRKEVENWRAVGEQRMTARRRRRSRRGRIKKNLELRELEAFLNVQTAVEVIN